MGQVSLGATWSVGRHSLLDQAPGFDSQVYLHSLPVHPPELRLRRWPAVTAVARHAGPRDRRDDPVRRDHADAVVGVIGDVEVAEGVRGQRDRPGKLGGRGWPTFSGATRVSISTSARR